MFLFILLAIASIYASKNQSLEEAIANRRILKEGQIAIDEKKISIYEQITEEFEEVGDILDNQDIDVSELESL
ncbi:uncharacterized protein METZ01_LOCUS483190, partial [marine metagenome]